MKNTYKYPRRYFNVGDKSFSQHDTKGRRDKGKMNGLD